MTDPLEIMMKARKKVHYDLSPVSGKGFEIYRYTTRSGDWENPDEDGLEKRLWGFRPGTDEYTYREANAEVARLNSREDMRAALLALAEAELPEDILSQGYAAETWVNETTFRSMLRSIANGKTE